MLKGWMYSSIFIGSYGHIASKEIAYDKWIAINESFSLCSQVVIMDLHSQLQRLYKDGLPYIRLCVEN